MENIQKKVVLSVVFSFLLVVPFIPQTAAFGWDDLNPMNWVESARDHVRDELERTRIGREINRMVDNLEVLEDLALVVGTIYNPAGLTALAIEVGQDPEETYRRFEERLDQLRELDDALDTFQEKLDDLEEAFENFESGGPGADSTDQIMYALNQMRMIVAEQALIQLIEEIELWVEEHEPLDYAEKQELIVMMEEALAFMHQHGLTDMEVAGALQSVLEEPALPPDVYLGDSCIVDFRTCPTLDDPVPPGNPWRGEEWGYSCYAQGVVYKKKVGGIYRAACKVSYAAHNGRIIDYVFPAEDEHGTYNWEICPEVHLTQRRQDILLENTEVLCPERIAGFTGLGVTCLREYENCAYNYGHNMNGLRVGSLVHMRHFSQAEQTWRNEYVCETTYAFTPVNPNRRESCEGLVVGGREVREYLAANPEPPPAPVTPPPVKQDPATQPQTGTPSSQNNVVAIGNNDDIIRIGDVTTYEMPDPLPPVFGRDGIVDVNALSPGKRKSLLAQELREFGIETLDIAAEVQRLQGQAVGFELPSGLREMFEDENVEIVVSRNVGEDVFVCVDLEDGTVLSLEICPESFTPDVTVTLTESSLDGLSDEEETALMQAFFDERTEVTPHGASNRVQYNILEWFTEW